MSSGEDPMEMFIWRDVLYGLERHRSQDMMTSHRNNVYIYICIYEKNECQYLLLIQEVLRRGFEVPGGKNWFLFQGTKNSF